MIKIPLVSIIIPTFGNPKFLERAIFSVLNQTYKNIELIIVDDNGIGTVNGNLTNKILSSYKNEKILYIRHGINKNGAAARNTGIRVANGKYISFLDSDDFLLANRVETSVIFLEKSPFFFGVIGDCFFYNSKGFVSKSELRALSQSDIKEVFIKKNQLGSGSNLFYRNERINPLFFDESLVRFQDIEFLLTILEKGKNIGKTDNVLLVKDTTKSTNPNIITKVIPAFTLFNNKFISILDSLSDKEKKCYFYETYNTNLSIVFSCQKLDDVLFYKNRIFSFSFWSKSNKLKLVFYPFYRIAKYLRKLFFGYSRKKCDNKEINSFMISFNDRGKNE